MTYKRWIYNRKTKNVDFTTINTDNQIAEMHFDDPRCTAIRFRRKIGDDEYRLGVKFDALDDMTEISRKLHYFATVIGRTGRIVEHGDGDESDWEMLRNH